ncbi:MAG: sporulation initiation factor Spo0A C-terminal domain-containing protein [Clostridiales bacterium]|nr:sporulation initiation factor Spo0A C-terminal domain-containing protein [Clostridiales bacterium]
MKKTSVELCRLGICPNYVGYQEMHLAIQLALEDPTRLTALVQQIYTPVGQTTGKNWTAVERNLRTVVRRAWEANPEYMQEIAGRPLERWPGTGEFLAMMWGYLASEEGEGDAMQD